jgi:hypothetical protein
MPRRCRRVSVTGAVRPPAFQESICATGAQRSASSLTFRQQAGDTAARRLSPMPMCKRQSPPTSRPNASRSRLPSNAASTTHASAWPITLVSSRHFIVRSMATSSATVSADATPQQRCRCCQRGKRRPADAHGALAAQQAHAQHDGQFVHAQVHVRRLGQEHQRHGDLQVGSCQVQRQRQQRAEA